MSPYLPNLKRARLLCCNLTNKATTRAGLQQDDWSPSSMSRVNTVWLTRTNSTTIQVCFLLTSRQTGVLDVTYLSKTVFGQRHWIIAEHLQCQSCRVGKGANHVNFHSDKQKLLWHPGLILIKALQGLLLRRRQSDLLMLNEVGS